MSKTPDCIELDADEIDAAIAWHGGQSSMLYAVASTGALRRGTHRPYGDDGPMSDDEWMQHLASKLAHEASQAAELAAKWECEDDSEAEEMERNHEAFLSMAAKAEAVAENE